MKKTKDDAYFRQCFLDFTKEVEVLIHNKSFKFLRKGRHITYQTFIKEPYIILCFFSHNTLCNDLASIKTLTYGICLSFKLYVVSISTTSWWPVIVTCN